MSTVAQALIEIDERGVAWIIGAKTKVTEVALDHLAHGWSPEEIYFQHHDGLSLAQIHAALSYYYDHQPEFDAEIRRPLDDVGSSGPRPATLLAGSGYARSAACHEPQTLYGRARCLRYQCGTAPAWCRCFDRSRGLHDNPAGPGSIGSLVGLCRATHLDDKGSQNVLTLKSRRRS